MLNIVCFRGDLNGALKRSTSPTSSDSSKENVEEEDNNNMNNSIRFPCPVCKKAFTKVANVYKHLASSHNKTKDQCMKLNKVIRNNAFVEDKVESEIEEMPPKLVFNKTKQTEEALQLAMDVGLVNRNGVGMQKLNGQVGRPRKNFPAVEPIRESGDFTCDFCGFASISDKGLAIHKGGGKCKRHVKETNLVNDKSDITTKTNGYESDENEVSFNLEKDATGNDSEGPERKRKRFELTKVETNGVNNGAWDNGQHACQICDKTFKTPTFLIQHYVTPHFRHELRR